jgi:ubiquinone/menaquinone biosynthesis C-methylase UbiE
MKTEWNYSDLAKPYLNRPDYSNEALDKFFQNINLPKESKVTVCDVGAGVAHLTIPLLERGFVVDAVEPNDEMRKLGSLRTVDCKNVFWYEGTGEDTQRPSGKFDIVTFGSSFNVTDRPKALIETDRLLKPLGWFACMWNHRDLEDPIQKAVENIITSYIPNYDYGTRREDQTQIINTSGLFKEVIFVEGNVMHDISKDDWVNAWRSHGTLARQAGGKFHQIIDDISEYVNKLPANHLKIPYTTKIWFAQKAR